MILPEEISFWLQTYSLFWLFYCIYSIVRSLKKFSLKAEDKREENETIAAQLYDSIEKFSVMDLIGFFKFLIAFVFSVLVAIDSIGLFLTYAYIPIENFKMILFIGTILMLIADYLRTIFKFLSMLKMIFKDVPQDDVVKLLEDMDKNIKSKIFSIIVRFACLYFALQLSLYTIF